MTFPRYERYKESGVEWLGVVPEGWDVKRLKRNFHLLTEKTDRRDHPVALENIESWSGRFIETETEFQGEGVAFNAGDILFGKLRPYLAKALLADQSGEAVGDFHVMRPCTGVSGRFAIYQILNQDFISIVDGSTFGAKMPRVSWDFMANLMQAIPPLPEQHTIAAFLDRETGKIDELVVEQERLIALLREKRQAVISHAVTKGLNPDAPMKDSGIEWLGEVPDGWDVVPMKYLVRLQSGGTPSKEQLNYWDGTLPWASAKDIKVEYLADTEDHITDFAIEQGTATLLNVGTVLVVVRGMILARTFPVTLTLEKMAINQDLKAIIAGTRLVAEFLAWYLRGTSEESLSRLDEAGHGTKALRMDKWTSLEIALPPFEEQSAIVAFLDSETAKIDTLVGEAQQAIGLLKERRSALISAAVTGKIDVRGAEINPPQSPLIRGEA